MTNNSKQMSTPTGVAQALPEGRQHDAARRLTRDRGESKTSQQLSCISVVWC